MNTPPLNTTRSRCIDFLIFHADIRNQLRPFPDEISAKSPNDLRHSEHFSTTSRITGRVSIINGCPSVAFRFASNRNKSRHLRCVHRPAMSIPSRLGLQSFQPAAARARQPPPRHRTIARALTRHRRVDTSLKHLANDRRLRLAFYGDITASVDRMRQRHPPGLFDGPIAARHVDVTE